MIKYYNLKEIKKEFTDKYYLPTGAEFNAAFTKKIRRTCEKIFVDSGGKKISLWEKSTTKKEGEYKREYAFSEAEKDMLCSKLEEYMVASSEDKKKLGKDIEERIKFQKKADEMNKLEEEYLWETRTAQDTDDPDSPNCYPSEFQMKMLKIELMLEALFLEKYTPIDEKKLGDDYACSHSVSGTTDHTAESEAAFDRYQNRAQNNEYYRRKENQ